MILKFFAFGWLLIGLAAFGSVTAPARRPNVLTATVLVVLTLVGSLLVVGSSIAWVVWFFQHVV